MIRIQPDPERLVVVFESSLDEQSYAEALDEIDALEPAERCEVNMTALFTVEPFDRIALEMILNKGGAATIVCSANVYEILSLVLEHHTAVTLVRG